MQTSTSSLPSDPELEALGRIIVLIKMYRQQTGNHLNPDLATSESVNNYLKQHLSIQDWVLWRWLQVTEQEPENRFILATA